MPANPTPTWGRIVRNTHTQYERVELMRDTGGVAMALPVAASSPGEAIEDATNTIRHYCRFSVIDRDGSLMPKVNTDLLAPVGRKVLRYMRGVVDPTNGESSEIVFGTYLVDSVGTSRDNPGLLEFECYDRFILAQKPSITKVTIPTGRPIPLAIQQVLRSVEPTISFLSMESPYVLPATEVPLDSNMVDVATEWASFMGAEVYMDRSDLAVITPVVIGEGLQQAVLSESEGVAVVGFSNRWSAREVPNGYIVHATAGGAEVIGQAWDENPASPTYRYGEYGEVPRHVTSDKVATVGQAQAMARGLLARELGGEKEVTLEHSPDPALTVGDRVGLDLPSYGLSGTWVIRRIELPIGAPGDPQSTTVVRASLSLNPASV